MSEKLNAFVSFLGAVGVDCSGDALEHTVDGKGNISFMAVHTSNVYTAYRELMTRGYKMGLKQGRIDALNEVAIECMNKLKG